VYDATATVNIGFELKTGGRTSLDLPLNFNMWNFGGTEQRAWKHVMLQPALRVWVRKAFDGHFFGVHGHWGAYMIAGLPVSDYMRGHHFEGDLVGGGISWGYRWKIGEQWDMETELGVGYARLKYKEYRWCGDCSEYQNDVSKNYFGPTKIALSLVYNFGGERSEPQRPSVERGRQPAGGLHSQSLFAPRRQQVDATLTPTFVVPYTEGAKERGAVVYADVRFVFDSSVLDENYMDNAAGLRLLREGVGDIGRDRLAAITSVNISGFASPEGSSSYNVSLSARRAEAVRDYLVAATGLPARVFTIRGEGERGEVSDSLRMATVEVRYTARPFSPDEIKRIIRTRPQMLSLDEMFRLSCTYNPESRDYREVFEIAAATFPHDDVANINAAAAALLHKDADAAAFYLERVQGQTDAWWDNLGIVFYLRGDLDRAAAAFSKAGTMGLDNAVILNGSR
jgi:outer membrane protein OmpA-like peptidoglycan-associated protein